MSSNCFFKIASVFLCFLTFAHPTLGSDQQPTITEQQRKVGLDYSKTALDDQFRILTFNLESGDADINYLMTMITRYMDEYDVIGFQEISPTWAQVIKGYIRKNSKNQGFILGTTGGADRLGLIYRTDRLTLLETTELNHINIGGAVRAPLVALLKVKTTGRLFYVINNHLYRSKRNIRHQQCELLIAWSNQLKYPYIALGDYNLDYDVNSGQSDKGLGILSKKWQWLEPEELVPTQCSVRYQSILDFVFIGGPGSSEWEASSKILESQDNYCPDNQMKSDHRPVSATIEI